MKEVGGDQNPFSADLIKKRDQQRVSAVHMDAYEILLQEEEKASAC